MAFGVSLGGGATDAWKMTRLQGQCSRGLRQWRVPMRDARHSVLTFILAKCVIHMYEREMKTPVASQVY